MAVSSKNRASKPSTRKPKIRLDWRSLLLGVLRWGFVAGIWAGVVLAGVVAHDGPGGPLNSAALFGTDGRELSRYDKVNLVLPTPEAATCAVQDMNLTFIGGKPLVVKLSAMCEYLGYIHTIVVSFGVLMWVFIVFRGK